VARVALDADVVIAFLDPGDDQHATAVAELRPRLVAGDELLVAATVYAETMVRPLQQGTDATVDQFFDAAGISIVPINRAIARRAAALRAEDRSLPSRTRCRWRLRSLPTPCCSPWTRGCVRSPDVPSSHRPDLVGHHRVADPALRRTVGAGSVMPVAVAEQVSTVVDGAGGSRWAARLRGYRSGRVAADGC